MARTDANTDKNASKQSQQKSPTVKFDSRYADCASRYKKAKREADKAAKVRALSAARNAARMVSGFVYFLRCEQFVKIGYSATPGGRLGEFFTCNPFPCHLIAEMPGGYILERNLHAQFAHLRVRGEWFLLDGEIADFVSALPQTQNAPPPPATGRGQRRGHLGARGSGVRALPSS